MNKSHYKHLGPAYLAHYARRLSDIINEQSIALMQHLNLITPPSSVSAMHFIKQNQPITGAQLADALAVTHQMATQRINVLIKLKLIKREPAEHDQRAKVIQLTTLGQQEMSQLEPFTLKMNHIFGELEQETGHIVSQVLLSTETKLRNKTLKSRFEKHEHKT